MARVGRILTKVAKWAIALGVAGFVASFATVVVATVIFASRGTDDIKPDSADVIIVLSAGVDRDAVELDPFSKARVDKAIELYNRGVAYSILMSGGVYLDTQENIAELMRAYAIDRGVPPGVISIEGNSISTFENARYTLKIIREDFVPDQKRNGRAVWRRAVLVTDDYHLLRSWTLFSYWRQDGDIEIVALAPATGRKKSSFMRATALIFRETLAVPFNVLKMSGQIALEQIGGGGEGVIR